MSYILCAGVVTNPPKENLFPVEGRPYSSVNLNVDDVAYHIVAHDDQMPNIAALMPGDAGSVQGQLVLVTKNRKLENFYVVAKTITPLRARSQNRMPAGCRPARCGDKQIRRSPPVFQHQAGHLAPLWPRKETPDVRRYTQLTPRQCSVCQETRPPSEFRFIRAHRGHGARYSARCRQCEAAARRDRFQRNGHTWNCRKVEARRAECQREYDKRAEREGRVHRTRAEIAAEAAACPPCTSGADQSTE
jgi:hypothetical protein